MGSHSLPNGSTTNTSSYWKSSHSIPHLGSSGKCPYSLSNRKGTNTMAYGKGTNTMAYSYTSNSLSHRNCSINFDSYYPEPLLVDLSFPFYLCFNKGVIEEY